MTFNLDQFIIEYEYSEQEAEEYNEESLDTLLEDEDATERNY